MNIRMNHLFFYVLHSPQGGGDLRQHSFYRGRAADQGRIDTVSGDRAGLLVHFRNLERKI